MIPVVNVTQPSDWDELYNIHFNFCHDKKYKTEKLFNLITFDIETTNGWRQKDGAVIGFDHNKYKNDEEYHKQIDNAEPISLEYIWQYAIEDPNRGPLVFVGRTWDKYFDFTYMLCTEIRRQSVYGQRCITRTYENAYAQKRKINVQAKIWIHNMSFEFQHLRNVFNDDFGKSRKKYGNVFARSSRKPMKAHVNLQGVNIEFRDTLVLTQKSLAAWCKDENLPVQKLKEPDDYYLIMRTPKTRLTQNEIQYSINDVVCMIYGLEKYRNKYCNIMNNKSLDEIPLTQTGAVRHTCRERVCAKNPGWAMLCTEITKSYTPDDFRDLCQLFQGGWTHANKVYVNRKLNNIKCYDFASSYPAVMCSRTYPISKFEDCDLSEFDYLESQDLNNPEYRWYAEIKLKNVKSKLWNSYWSLSKVTVIDKKPQIKGQIVDNGRIYSCSEMTIKVTDLDWDTFKQAYDYDQDTVEVIKLRKAQSGYLCRELILTILEYFAYKTSLKGDPDAESLYVESKQFINSVYGCAVTKIITDLIEFNIDGWHKTECDDIMFQDTIDNVKEEQTFLAYQHGIWVTSWARHNLWDFIIELDKRIVYCDTDSIKGLFNEKDLKFIEKYNKQIEDIENNVAIHLGFDPNLFTATTKKGKIKRLGIMEREDDCQEFKTLGAKRYVDLVDGEIQCTIAGLPKSAGKKKLKSVDEFKDQTMWDTKESEKLTAVYNDNQPDSVWIDRDGNIWHSSDRYGICLAPTTFDLSMSKEFIKFLQVLQTGKIDKDDEFFKDTTSYLI